MVIDRTAGAGGEGHAVAYVAAGGDDEGEGEGEGGRGRGRVGGAFCAFALWGLPHKRRWAWHQEGRGRAVRGGDEEATGFVE